MSEFSRYIVTVDYTKYVGGSEPEVKTTATLTVWDRGEEQARGQAKRHVAAVVGDENVGSTALKELSESVEFDPHDREWVICDEGTMRPIGEWPDEDSNRSGEE